MAPLDADSLWLILCAALVGLLPIGLLAVELGDSRPAGIRTAPVRVGTDLVVAVLLTWLFGFSWVHGPSLAGLVGLAPGPVDLGGAGASWRASLATWHGLGVGAAVVIAGAGGSERARPVCSLLTAALVAGVILPLTGHWLHGGRPDGIPVGWLARLGVIDHGNAIAVHVAAGAAGLALTAALGPRRGRYDGLGRPRRRPVRANAMQVIGGGLVVLGSLGLVAGGRFGWRAEVPGAILVGLLAAAAGVAGGLVARRVGRLPTHPVRAGRLGAVAGLVSVSAAALLGGPAWGAATGFIGGGLAVLADHHLLHRGFDDPVGVGSAHLVGGLWAAVAAAFAVDAPGLPLRIAIQLLGGLAVAGTAGLLTHGVLALIDRWVPLRVTPFSEEFGSGELTVVERG
ncbi:MAG: ammonium transporter [Deltaproteobacteria bacterium]|nr:MAG: ammonium transporter [Deltaproteobacteria bacterium]